MAFSSNANIENNQALRRPQRAGWDHIREHYLAAGAAREIGIVLPVGCGKSGLISITPFAVGARRVLVIAPGVRIRQQLANDLKASSATNFYARCGILDGHQEFPDTVVVESGRVNLDDLRHCDIAVANIQQVAAGEDNRWLSQLDRDFFDLILVDEAHHNVAASWQQVKERFPNARIVNFSATPTRADGRLMEGEIKYSFPVIEAIQAGYVKRLRAKMLRPTELRYVDPSDGQPRIVGPDEVRRLGEDDAAFRRGIVMAEETLASIVDCAIGELRRLRTETGEQRLKIIASVRMKLTSAMANIVEQVQDELEVALDEASRQRMRLKKARKVAWAKLGKLQATMATLLPQIRYWIKTGWVAANKVVSLQIPEIYAIVRGKVGKKVEFGLQWGMTRLRGGFVLATLGKEKNELVDSVFAVRAAKDHQALFGKAPKAYAYDRAGWSEANVAELKQLGVRAVGLAPRGKAKWQVAGKVKDKLVSERAQVEGCIGSVKSRKYGFNKPAAKSAAGMAVCGQRSVLGFNLNKLVNGLAERRRVVLVG